MEGAGTQYRSTLHCTAAARTRRSLSVPSVPLWWIAFSILLPVPLLAQDITSFRPTLTASGYVKYLHGASWVNAIDQLTTSDLVHHRLNLSSDIAPHINLRMGMRNRFFYGEAVKLQPGTADLVDVDTGTVRMSALWVNEPGAVLLTTIDRAVARYARDRWEVHLGRQRINWGIHNVWNPNDLFNAFNFLDFDYEERPGSDAVRLVLNPALDHTVEAAFALGTGPDDHIAAGLYRFNRRRFDYQVLAGVYRADLVVGGGWAGHISDAGFKGEASWFVPRNRPLDSTSVFTASIMVDRTFQGDWYLSASYLYNSQDDAATGFTSPLLGLPLSAKRLLPFTHTLYAGVNKTFTPITGINLAVLYSPHLNTAVLFPSYTWNVANGFDLDLTVQSFLAGDSLAWRAQGNAAYLRIRWSH